MNKLLHVVMVSAMLLSNLAWSAVFASPAGTVGPRCYVNDDASGTDTGADWTDAYTNLQSALIEPACTEIWVAAGIYKPSDSEDYDATFQLRSGVALYGGFAGTETTLAARSWDANPTILSGDLDGNGSFGYPDSAHVVTGSGTDATAILDGFTITGGNGEGSDGSYSGGGMYIIEGSPTLINLIFEGNRAHYGGGMYSQGGSPTLTHVTFWSNYARERGSGGGMLNEGSSPTLTDVIFTSNNGYYGGGMANASGSSPILMNVTFSSNSSLLTGAGMYNEASSPKLTNVVFFENSATNNGGGMANWYTSNPTLTNVTMYNNLAEVVGGGGMYNSGSSPSLTNSIVWGNEPDQIAGGLGPVSYSIVQGGVYSGTHNLSVDPQFVDPASGNLRLKLDSPAIDAGNNAAPGLSEVTIDLDGSPRFVEIPGVPDTGSGTPPIVDLGAYEAQAGPSIIYVDKDAPGPVHNGRTWERAFTRLQDGLAAAPEAGNEIWVAAGVYNPSASGDPIGTYQLKSEVAVYGGFAGTETTRDARDWTANPTILSGDLDGSSSPTYIDAYHVVTGSGVDVTAVLDGFTITGGYASGGPRDYDYQGGGMLNIQGSPTLKNLIISINASDWVGGGMYNEDSSPTLTNVTFSGNRAGWHGHGGGMSNVNSHPILTDVSFGYNHGGGIGGGMSNFDSDPILINVSFLHNSAYVSGGGMYNSGSSPALTNVIFVENSTDNYGGGIANRGGRPTLTNVTFSGNSADDGGGMINNDGSPTLINVIFHGNNATIGGGMYSSGGSPRLANVTFHMNAAELSDDPTYQSGLGGGMFISGGNPGLVNVTFSGNSAESYGGGLYNTGSSTLANSILWGNTAITGTQISNLESGTIYISHSDIQGAFAGGAWDSSIGTNMGAILDTDPLFVDSANGDLHLLDGSPAIDTGDNSLLPADTTDLDEDGNITEPILFDLDGKMRMVDYYGSGTPTVDMGAYEAQEVVFSVFIPVTIR